MLYDTQKEELSNYATVLDTLGQAITDNTEFDGVPVYWDMIELMPDNMPTSAIVLQGKPYQLDETHCLYEKQLDMEITNLQNQLKLAQQREEAAQKMVDDGCKSIAGSMGR